jgi:hypothetical protein
VERVLVGADEFQHLCGLGCSDIRWMGSALADAVVMDVQHDWRRRLDFLC